MISCYAPEIYYSYVLFINITWAWWRLASGDQNMLGPQTYWTLNSTHTPSPCVLSTTSSKTLQRNSCNPYRTSSVAKSQYG